jgi:hypothetical protein
VTLNTSTINTSTINNTTINNSVNNNGTFNDPTIIGGTMTTTALDNVTIDNSAISNSTLINTVSTDGTVLSNLRADDFLVANTAVASGIGSIAFALNTVASGAHCVAIGRAAAATDFHCIALGSGSIGAGFACIAVGDNANVDAGAGSSIAIGRDANVTGIDSTAVGRVATATALESTGFGSRTTASGAQSTALGQRASATNTACTAVGSNAVANGNTATAVGSSAQASGGTTIAIGDSSLANASGAIAIGSGSQALVAGGSALGQTAIASAAGAVQLGLGTNVVANSLQHRAYQIHNGAVPGATSIVFKDVNGNYVAGGATTQHTFIDVGPKLGLGTLDQGDKRVILQDGNDTSLNRDTDRFNRTNARLETQFVREFRDGEILCAGQGPRIGIGAPTKYNKYDLEYGPHKFTRFAHATTWDNDTHIVPLIFLRWQHLTSGTIRAHACRYEPDLSGTIVAAPYSFDPGLVGGATFHLDFACSTRRPFPFGAGDRGINLLELNRDGILIANGSYTNDLRAGGVFVDGGWAVAAQTPAGVNNGTGGEPNYRDDNVYAENIGTPTPPFTGEYRTGVSGTGRSQIKGTEPGIFGDYDFIGLGSGWDLGNGVEPLPLDSDNGVTLCALVKGKANHQVRWSFVIEGMSTPFTEPEDR